MDCVSKHLRNCHTAEIGVQVLSSLYRVLQDLNGRQLEPVSDPIGVFSDNYNLQSYRLLVKKGLIHNHREMVQYKGPFRCHICGEETFQKLILAHWVKHHPGIFKQFRMVDVSTQKLLGSHDLFKCLALCPASDCYNVIGQNYKIFLSIMSGTIIRRNMSSQQRTLTSWRLFLLRTFLNQTSSGLWTSHGGGPHLHHRGQVRQVRLCVGEQQVRGGHVQKDQYT